MNQLEYVPLRDNNNQAPTITNQTPSNGKASFKSATFNLTNTIIGGGMLSLPYAMKTCGFINGLIILTLVGVLCTTSAHFLIKSAQWSNLASYKDLAIHCFPGRTSKYGGILVDICVIVFLSGACVSYIVIIGDILTPFIYYVIDTKPEVHDINEANLYRRTIMGITSLLILFPLMLLRRMDSLRYTSMAAIGCIAYLVGVIIGKSFFHGVADGFQHQRIEYFRWSTDIFIVLPIISFAFTFHMNIFPISTEMEHPSRINQVIYSSVAICTVTYACVGIAGYLTFFDLTKGNILVNYNVDEYNDAFMEISRVALAFIICFSYPILGYTARSLFDRLIFTTDVDRPPLKRILAEAIGFVSITFVLAASVPGVEFVFSLVGASVGNLAVYILPCFFYMTISTRMNDNMEASTGWVETLKIWTQSKYLHVLVIFFSGAFFMIVSLVSIFISL